MKLSERIEQDKNYLPDFDASLFFIKLWEKDNNNPDADHIDIAVTKGMIYMSNMNSAFIELYKERIRLSLRDRKTGKETKSNKQIKEQYIKEALNGLFCL